MITLRQLRRVRVAERTRSVGIATCINIALLVLMGCSAETGIFIVIAWAICSWSSQSIGERRVEGQLLPFLKYEEEE